MEISPVLSLAGDKASNQSGMLKGINLQQEGMLFSFVLSDILGSAQGVKGQVTEGMLSALSITLDDKTADSSKESLIGHNMFLQTLQNLFPAGMDANSGLIGEQNQEDGLLTQIALAIVNQGNSGESPAESLQKALGLLAEGKGLSGNHGHVLLHNQQISMEKPILDTVISQKDIGSEGIKNPISREILSLSPAELDKYIETLNLLKELSGQVKTVQSQSPHTTDSLQKMVFLISQYQSEYKVQNQGIQNQQSVYSQQGEVLNQGGSNTFVSSKADPHASSKTSEAISVQSIPPGQASNPGAGGMQENEVNLMAGHLDSGNTEKVTSESSLNKTDSNNILYGQQNLNKSENAGINQRAVPNTDIFSARLMDQVMEHLKRQDFSQIKELSIQLHPAELGKMNFSVRLENGQVHLFITASESSTANFLQNNLTDLRQGLSQSGINFGTLEMGYQHNGKDNPQGQYHHGEKDTVLKTQEEEKSYYPEFVSARPGLESGSRINIKA